MEAHEPYTFKPKKSVVLCCELAFSLLNLKRIGGQ